MCTSLPELKHFFMVHFMNLMQASTCPLLWQWYDEDTACSIFKLLQKFLNFSEIKLLPTSDISLLGMPYSEITTLNVDIKLSAVSPSTFFITKNLL